MVHNFHELINWSPACNNSEVVHCTKTGKENSDNAMRAETRVSLVRGEEIASRSGH